MYNIFYSTSFEKDRDLAIRRGLDVAKLDEAVEILASGEVPPRRLADHPLKGNGLAVENAILAAPRVTGFSSTRNLPKSFCSTSFARGRTGN